MFSSYSGALAGTWRALARTTSAPRQGHGADEVLLELWKHSNHLVVVLIVILVVVLIVVVLVVVLIVVVVVVSVVIVIATVLWCGRWVHANIYVRGPAVTTSFHCCMVRA